MVPDSATADIPAENPEFETLIAKLGEIRADMLEFARLSGDILSTVHANFRESARNLLHYLALRRRDLRPLQTQLAHLGLSSLGRAESHVLATIDAVLRTLHQLVGRPWSPAPDAPAALDFESGHRLLEQHTAALLGDPPVERPVRIMVTMPTEAADDYTLVHDLANHGMNCMRINCAHDDAAAWSRMIQNLRQAEQATQRSCRLLMDLAGPKVRTGPLEPGPAVVKFRPERDAFGRVVKPARVWLTALESPRSPPTAADAALSVPREWLAGLRVGDRVKFTDARFSKRSMKIVDVTADGCWAEAEQTAYMTPGIELRARNRGKGPIGELPPRENAIPLKKGDLIKLTRGQALGRPAVVDRTGQLLTPASIGCSLSELLDFVKAGEHVWFDDGNIGGTVEKPDADGVHVRITNARPGAKLRADKGINFPDTDLKLPAMTEKDVEDLDFIAQHADMVALSFANRVEDVENLQQRLSAFGDRRPAIVLKIETRRGFENLPNMLLSAMAAPCCGVMIARGDLAVECGFERLAEVQEEMLWMCEAAHVPVIWATQVLETLAKQGFPSRAEITDAAMGHRAECVMLNKGPHILDAVQTLDDILRRMQGHQIKKRAMLRELHLASTFLGV